MKRHSKTWYISIALGIVMLVLLITLIYDTLTKREDTSETDKTTISLVYAYQNSTWNSCIEEIVRLFEDAYPDIDVEYEIRYADSVYDDVLYKLAARDELGDVVQLKEPYIWSSGGLIAPLPDSLAELVNVSCEIDSKSYAVSALGTTTGIVYNKAIFEQYNLSEPTTYQEFLDICTTLKQEGVTPLGVGGTDLWYMEYWLNHFLRADILSNEPDFLALCSAGESDWYDPMVESMLTHLAQLFEQKFVDEGWQTTSDGALAYYMVDGDVAMVYSGPWLVEQVRALAPEMKLGWFYIPNEDGLFVAGESEDVFWAVTEGCARDESRYNAAITFLNFFYSEGVYEQLCEYMSSYSALTDKTRGNYEKSEIISDIAQSHQDADLHISTYIGNEDTPIGFEKRLLNLLISLCNGEYTVSECQQKMQDYWELCLQQEAAYE